MICCLGQCQRISTARKTNTLTSSASKTPISMEKHITSSDLELSTATSDSCEIPPVAVSSENTSSLGENSSTSSSSELTDHEIRRSVGLRTSKSFGTSTNEIKQFDASPSIVTKTFTLQSQGKGNNKTKTSKVISPLSSLNKDNAKQSTDAVQVVTKVISSGSDTTVGSNSVIKISASTSYPHISSESDKPLKTVIKSIKSSVSSSNPLFTASHAQSIKLSESNPLVSGKSTTCFTSTSLTGSISSTVDPSTNVSSAAAGSSFTIIPETPKQMASSLPQSKSSSYSKSCHSSTITILSSTKSSTGSIITLSSPSTKSSVLCLYSSGGSLTKLKPSISSDTTRRLSTGSAITRCVPGKTPDNSFSKPIKQFITGSLKPAEVSTGSCKIDDASKNIIKTPNIQLPSSSTKKSSENITSDILISSNKQIQSGKSEPKLASSIEKFYGKKEINKQLESRSPKVSVDSDKSMLILDESDVSFVDSPAIEKIPKKNKVNPLKKNEIEKQSDEKTISKPISDKIVSEKETNICDSKNEPPKSIPKVKSLSIESTSGNSPDKKVKQTKSYKNTRLSPHVGKNTRSNTPVLMTEPRKTRLNSKERNLRSSI